MSRRRSEGARSSSGPPGATDAFLVSVLHEATRVHFKYLPRGLGRAVLQVLEDVALTHPSVAPLLARARGGAADVVLDRVAAADQDTWASFAELLPGPSDAQRGAIAAMGPLLEVLIDRVCDRSPGWEFSAVLKAVTEALTRATANPPPEEHEIDYACFLWQAVYRTLAARMPAPHPELEAADVAILAKFRGELDEMLDPDEVPAAPADARAALVRVLSGLTMSVILRFVAATQREGPPPVLRN